MKQSFNEIEIQEDCKNNIYTNTYENLIFKNKNAIEYAIKNINNEMEKDRLKFSKLFKDNNIHNSLDLQK